MAVQWSLALDKTIHELTRVATPGGLIALALPIEGTLSELSQACRAIGHAQPESNFFSQNEIDNTLQSIGLKILSQNSETYRYHFDNIFSLIRSLKAIGANRLKHNHKSYYTTKNFLPKLERHYPTDNESLPLSYRIYYMIAQNRSPK
jgi:hypothetical protein